MSPSSNKLTLLHNLRERLARLNCVAHFSRRYIIDAYSVDQISAQELSAFLNNNVGFVERWFAPISEPTFCALCNKLVQIKDHREVLRILGVSVSDDITHWYQHVLDLQSDQPGCLYALANLFVLPLNLIADIKATAIILLADGLKFARRDADSLLLMETYPNCVTPDYSLENIGRTLASMLSGLSETTGALFANGVSESLLYCERFEESARVVESYIGLDVYGYFPRTLPDLLERRFSSMPRAFSVLLVTGLAESLRMAEKAREAHSLIEAYLHLNAVTYTESGLDAHLTRHLDGIHPINAFNLLVVLADTFEVTRMEDAVRVLEARLALTPQDYTSPNFADILKTRFLDVPDDTAIIVVTALTQALKWTDREDQALPFIEAFFGLRPPDYAEPTLARWLSVRLPCVDVGNGTAIHMLAEQLSEHNRRDHALILYESFLHLSGVDYSAASFADEIRTRVSYLPANNKSVLLGSFAELLGNVGRPVDGIRVMEAFLGWDSEVYTSDDFDTELHLSLRGLHNSNAASICLRLGTLLSEGQRLHDSLVLMETYLSIRHEEYQAPSFASAITRRLKSVGSNSAAAVICSLGGVLVQTNRREDSVFLLLAFCGLPWDHTAWPDVRDHVGRRWPDLATNNCAAAIYKLGFSLRLINRPAATVTLIERYLRLEYVSDERDYFARWEQALKGIDENNSVALITEYATCLNVVGRAEACRYVLQSYCNIFWWFEQPGSGFSISNSVQLAQAWVRYCCKDSAESAMAFFRRVMEYLNRELKRCPKALWRSKAFAGRLKVLQRHIRECLAHWLAAEHSPEKRREIQRYNIQTDISLGQFALFERFVNGACILFDPDFRTFQELKPWPFPEPGPLDTWNRWSRDSLIGNQAANGQARHPEIGDVGKVPTMTVQNAEVPTKVSDESGLFLGSGVTEAGLASLLGVNTVLLRATFDDDETLRWWAMRSNGVECLPLADNLADEPHPFNQGDIRWASALHDLEIEWVYLLERSSQPDGLRSDLISRVEKVSVVLKDPALCDSALVYLNELMEGFSAEVMGALVPLLLPPAAVDQRCEWCLRASRWWSKAESLFQEKGDMANVDDFVSSLDNSTSTFLGTVSAIWNLQPLIDALTAELGGKSVDSVDVVVQVDDVLHSVSVPHLSVGGKPLFEHFRSCRVSLSVLVDALQERIDLRAAAARADTRRMLAVSWFDPGCSSGVDRLADASGCGAVVLHKLLSETAQASGLEYHAAAEEPSALRNTLFCALRNSAYAVATVLGHGDPVKLGVYLADGLWNGQGGELDGVEFLLIPSCSIGRVNKSGFRDVEGFCVTLALQKARSVLACRWRVNAMEAPYFANAVAAEFLKLRETLGTTAANGRLRARAVNQVRTRLLRNNQRTERGHVGLNTAAAFELYGRG